MAFTCGRHQAFVYQRGGLIPVGELTPLQSVRWSRRRDDISDAEATIGTTQCCELLGDLRTILHELHIVRDGVTVWQGPITRLEYEWDIVRVYAADLLWQSTRRVLMGGYDQQHPNIGNVIDRMHWLMGTMCYLTGGLNPWNVTLHPLHHPGDPKTSRTVANYQYYVWEDFDKYAEDMGADYTCVNRDIYYWDINLMWKVIPPISEHHLSQFPRVVEYGNQTATRGVVSNSKGYAGISTNTAQQAVYGLIDRLTTNEGEGGDAAVEDSAPTAADIAAWTETAARNINGRAPSPVAVVIPANTSLLPGAPWGIADLFPGAWFDIDITRLCRSVSETQRIHEVVVTEAAPEGEKVSFTAISSPSSVVIPEVLL